MTVVLNLSSVMNPLENLMNDMESISTKGLCFPFQGVYKPMKSIGAQFYRSWIQNILSERKIPFFFEKN